jgi:hypothetical protein
VPLRVCAWDTYNGNCKMAQPSLNALQTYISHCNTIKNVESCNKIEVCKWSTMTIPPSCQFANESMETCHFIDNADDCRKRKCMWLDEKAACTSTTPCTFRSQATCAEFDKLQPPESQCEWSGQSCINKPLKKLKPTTTKCDFDPTTPACISGACANKYTTSQTCNADSNCAWDVRYKRCDGNARQIACGQNTATKCDTWPECKTKGLKIFCEDAGCQFTNDKCIAKPLPVAV